MNKQNIRVPFFLFLLGFMFAVQLSSTGLESCNKMNFTGGPEPEDMLNGLSAFTRLDLLQLTQYKESLSPCMSVPSVKKNLHQVLEDLNVNIIFNSAKKMPALLEQGVHRELAPTTSIYTFSTSLRSILRGLNERDGYVQMDCQLFVQVADLLLGDLADAPGFTLQKGFWSPEELSLSSDRKIVYMYPSDEDACATITNYGMFLNEKGMWLIRDEKEWTGLTGKGVEWHSEEEWKLQQRNKLEQECLGHMKNPSNRFNIEAKMVHVLILQGKFEGWEFSSSNEDS